MKMNPRYQEWLKYVFDHEVTYPEWYFSTDDSDCSNFGASDSETAELIELTFRRAGEDLVQFTDAQVDQGINYLASPSCSNYMFAVRDGEVPLAKKLSAIDSIYSLYANCFARRCSEILGHLDEKGSALNDVCYMFWDVCVLGYLEKSAEKAALAEAVFAVLEKTLTIEHRACREGALHGLNHLAPFFPTRVKAVVEKFLSATKLDEDMLRYATSAAKGMVQ
ncbi:MAG: hypothetical protein HY043_06125 [Verrucomicrobia bacterium]|nr:hypothetical protein [Verrucomicrobiota bacterium]